MAKPHRTWTYQSEMARTLFPDDLDSTDIVAMAAYEAEETTAYAR
jgi:hypothetical protein